MSYWVIADADGGIANPYDLIAEAHDSWENP